MTSSHNQQRLTNGSLLEDLLADYSTAPPAGPHHSLPSDLRADMMESISSMKITLGCITPATANSTFTCMQERPKNQLSSGSTLHQFNVATAWDKIQSPATSIIVVYGTVQCSTVLKQQSSDTSSGRVQAAPPPSGVRSVRVLIAATLVEVFCRIACLAWLLLLKGVYTPLCSPLAQHVLPARDRTGALVLVPCNVWCSFHT